LVVERIDHDDEEYTVGLRKIVEERLQYDQEQANEFRKRIQEYEPNFWEITDKVENLIKGLLCESIPAEGKYIVIERICEWYEKGNKSIDHDWDIKTARCQNNFDKFIDVAFGKYCGITADIPDEAIKTALRNDLLKVLELVEDKGTKDLVKKIKKKFKKLEANGCCTIL